MDSGFAIISDMSLQVGEDNNRILQFRALNAATNEDATQKVAAILNNPDAGMGQGDLPPLGEWTHLANKMDFRLVASENNSLLLEIKEKDNPLRNGTKEKVFFKLPDLLTNEFEILTEKGRSDLMTSLRREPLLQNQTNSPDFRAV